MAFTVTKLKTKFSLGGKEVELKYVNDSGSTGGTIASAKHGLTTVTSAYVQGETADGSGVTISGSTVTVSNTANTTGRIKITGRG